MISATRLFVGNLPENTEQNDLLTAFSAFGEVTTLDLKSKPGTENENKKFAFVSISADNVNVESCIKHFSNEDFKGTRLYVTRARESFLERLQREREQAQRKDEDKLQTNTNGHLPKKNPVINLGDRLNPKKRKIDIIPINDQNIHKNKKNVHQEREKVHDREYGDSFPNKNLSSVTVEDKKKHEAERKRVESMKKKRQEFKEKQMIIKTGLTGVDKVQNKKIVFDDNVRVSPTRSILKNKAKETNKKAVNTLFDGEEDSDDNLNFEVKKQFEGKKGQKVLDLQSRYKSDKRFTLDERFIDNEEESGDEKQTDNDTVEISCADEKEKQMSILQNVLGVTLKTRNSEIDSKKSKPKLGMLRFDPMQPDHARFLAPVETKPEPIKKSKKGKDPKEEVKETQPELNVPKVEVSKEQFYKVTDALKEAIAQPNTFSLRSLFGNNENVDDGPQEQETDYIPIEKPKPSKKVKNPLEPTEKNPFVYDSSDSETEEPEKKKETKIELPPPTETKAVWKENLFFSNADPRLRDGLAYFNRVSEGEVQKERRELKSLVKKRIYNKDRKNQMFKKKIGGKKKSMKKPYKNKG